MSTLSHITPQGDAHMVDVSDKQATTRTATAQAQIVMQSETLALIAEGRAAKGDVIATARIAGIMGAKRTSDLIPLCHPLPIKKVTVDFDLDENLPGVHVTATVKTQGQTGVEMEALTAAATAALTLYDMLKAAEKGICIRNIRLLEKHGGKSGSWVAE